MEVRIVCVRTNPVFDFTDVIINIIKFNIHKFVLFK